MRIATLLSTLLLAILFSVAAQESSSQNNPQQPSSTPSGSTTLTGCLKGSPDQFYIVDKGGHHHTLMAGQDLSSFVNHEVTVSGKVGRKPGKSNNVEGHSSGFFRVESVSDNGYCKKK